MFISVESLHHDPDEVKHTQKFTESLLCKDAVPFLLLKYTQDAAL